MISRQVLDEATSFICLVQYKKFDLQKLSSASVQGYIEDVLFFDDSEE